MNIENGITFLYIKKIQTLYNFSSLLVTSIVTLDTFKNIETIQPASKKAATTTNPNDRLPVALVIKPRILGPTIPPRTPNELIVAIAVAAATPENILIGYVHKGGIADKSPAVAMDKAINITNGSVATELRKKPRAEASKQNKI